MARDEYLDFEGTEVGSTRPSRRSAASHIAVITAGGGMAAGRSARTARARRLPGRDRPEPDRHLQPQPALGVAHGEERANEDGERGVIINTASIAAFEGQIGQVAYTAAKAGIAGMCLTMARDLGLGIRVNAIAPSLFATGLTAGIPDEFEAS